MHYQISILDTTTHFIKLTWTIDYVHQDTIHIQQPSWRPGRYELQNYVKNVRCFAIADENGNHVPFKKLSKDKWEVDTSNAKKIIVTYEYYANQLDAGASFVNDEFLYINPVNCFMYVEGRMDEEYILDFELPQDYIIACQLPTTINLKHQLTAKNFDTLADSPLIASATMHHFEFDVNANRSKDNKEKSKIHFWFQGEPHHDMQKMIDETIAYTNEQVALFGDLPSHDFHFLYHILPTLFRHGVEHTDSTVIAMGPATDWSNPEFYDSFMAISSHELFHLWNIKRIRPVEMLPYDFTKENYSNLGYVYEGITTYYGDIILLRSGVWNWQQYSSSFTNDLQKHLSNTGRFNYSVAESSFDTWIDGYTPGTLGRKVSIYIEGMLAALIADVLIIKHSDGKYSLDNVMHDLYNQFYKHEKGYTEADYKDLLEKYSGISFTQYFKEIIWGKGHFNKWLTEAINLIGCEINFETAQLTAISNPNVDQEKIFNFWSRTRVI
jgi:predicted metalloprotease with PDZ domain